MKENTKKEFINYLELPENENTSIRICEMSLKQYLWESL